MKKQIAIFTTGILTATLMFAGCNGRENVTNNDPGQISESVENAPVSDKAKVNKLDEKWLKNVSEFYDSKEPDGQIFLQRYVEGMRGSASFHPDCFGCVSFGYKDTFGNGITLYINKETDKVSVEADVRYTDSEFFINGPEIELDEIESYIDDLIEGKAEYEAYDESALEQNADDLKKDLAIIYSRLIVFSDNAFPELGLTLEDYGIDLGDKYRNANPGELLSTEHSVCNDHVFENGYCTDCQMYWSEYLRNALFEYFGREYDEGTNIMAYGQCTPGMLNDGDEVLYRSSKPDTAILEYSSYDRNTGIKKDFYINISKNKSGKDIAIIRYDFGQCEVSENNMRLHKYNYNFQIVREPSDIMDLFTVKDSFKTAAYPEFTVLEEGGEYTQGWEKYTDAELMTMTQADGGTYYDRDEFLDMAWEDMKVMIPAIDKGMIWFDTSLEDMGIEY